MIEPGTELKVTDLSHGKRFALGLGKLEASVARQRPFRPLVVTTAQAEARVLGTRFTLAATTNATRVLRISPAPLVVDRRSLPSARGDGKRSEWRSGDRELRVLDAAVHFEHFARYPRRRR